MKTNFTLVTGNKGKLTEFKRLLPPNIEFDHCDIDLDEVQSADSKVIITAKAKTAYEILKRPVVVEDVSAGLVELGGMPGPFIKYFEITMGMDALYKLRGKLLPLLLAQYVTLMAPPSYLGSEK